MGAEKVLISVCTAVAATLLAAFFTKTYIDKKNWETAKINFDKSVADIHEQIRKAKEDACAQCCETDFKVFMEIRREIIQTADSTHSMFETSNCFIDKVKASIREADDNIAIHGIILDGKMCPDERKSIYKEYRDLIDAKRLLKEQLNTFYDDRKVQLEKVRIFNRETHELNEFIRDNCGNGGRLWYERHEQRKIERR